MTGVGIIGAGRIGQAMARVATRAGRSVVIANSRGPDLAADGRAGRTSSEIVAEIVAGARVVKAANTLGAQVLGSDPHEAGGQRVIFISGDDADANAEVAALFRDAGFAPIDLGDLATGGALQQVHHPLAGVNLIRL
jgi:predicted dinucleotide-binding enzyme